MHVKNIFKYDYEHSEEKNIYFLQMYRKKIYIYRYCIFEKEKVHNICNCGQHHGIFFIRFYTFFTLLFDCLLISLRTLFVIFTVDYLCCDSVMWTAVWWRFPVDQSCICFPLGESATHYLVKNTVKTFKELGVRANIKS